MTPEQIELVQKSFDKVEPIADAAADIFYDTLFSLDPTLEPLFTGDLDEQKKKLMTMLGTAVRSLTNLEKLVPVVQRLGERHVDYGVKDPHYDTVGAALLSTLEKGLGDDFTPDTKEAWTQAYVILSTTMKDAASKVAA